MGLLAQINLHHLRIFQAVYRTRSMTLAAKELHLTQSGVSQQVKALEDHLGVTLFDRVNRKLMPTSVADTFYSDCTRQLDELELALERIATTNSQLAGKIRIGFPPIFGQYVLLPLLSRFSRENPGVTFSFRLGLTSEIMDDLSEGELDFAFLDSPPATPHLVTEAVHREHVDLYGHKDILSRYDDFELSMRFFKKLPYLEYLPGEPFLRSWFATNFGSVPHQFNVVATIMDSNGLARLIAEGLGFGLLPEALSHQLLTDKNIQRIESPARMVNQICISHLDKRTMSPQAHRLYHWIKAEISRNE